MSHDGVLERPVAWKLGGGGLPGPALVEGGRGGRDLLVVILLRGNTIIQSKKKKEKAGMRMKRDFTHRGGS